MKRYAQSGLAGDLSHPVGRFKAIKKAFRQVGLRVLGFGGAIATPLV
ncbi:MAG: hypothetical protein IJR66_00015 [Clostridia bacterium]|nr:hypothetical protein [Clostridia bacterium]MBQ9513356.1 hypothetical protein [Clostridia bacterium]